MTDEKHFYSIITYTDKTLTNPVPVPVGVVFYFPNEHEKLHFGFLTALMSVRISPTPLKPLLKLATHVHILRFDFNHQENDHKQAFTSLITNYFKKVLQKESNRMLFQEPVTAVSSKDYTDDKVDTCIQIIKNYQKAFELLKSILPTKQAQENAGNLKE